MFNEFKLEISQSVNMYLSHLQMTSNGVKRQGGSRYEQRARVVSLCHRSGHNSKSNLVQENPGADRITLKLYLTFSGDGHAVLEAKTAGEE